MFILKIGFRSSPEQQPQNIPKGLNSQRKSLSTPVYTVIFLLAVVFVLIFNSFFSSVCAYETDETSCCTFFYYPENKAAVHILIKNADTIVENISKTTGFRLKKKVSVVIVSAYQDFQNAQPKGVRLPVWAIGVAYPSKNLIIILKKKNVDLIKTFQHEMTHILLGQFFTKSKRMPRWLNEGLAMIVAGDWSMSRLSTMTSAVLTDSLLPMDSIVDSFPGDIRNAELAYCQSFYFISFLKGKFGAEAFKLFLSEYAVSGDFNRAIQSTYHMSWESMDVLWLSYLAVRFSWIPVLTSTGFLWFIASIIFIAGYFRKKKKVKQKLEQWAREEESFYDDE